MRFGFRVATDPRFGAGHLARCRSVAQALGEPVTLFADPGEPPGNERENWTRIVLEEAPEYAAKATWALSLGQIDALVFDSYALDVGTVADAAAVGATIAFRDDPSYGPERITIDCNPGAVPSASTLAGPCYMPLAPTFSDMHKQARRAERRSLSKLAIAFGARDSSNTTAIALDAVARLSDKPQTAVALSTSALHADMVSRKIENLPWVERFPDQNAMSELYRCYDLAIGSPGVSQFERACCGVPTILLPQNDRQRPLAAAWAQTGAAICCEPEPDALAKVLTVLMNDQKRISDMRECGLNLVDGEGAKRLADELKVRLVQ
jgi:spore coat polysaccharide biosynthesis predicted glycosyltransferase SpsG